MADRTRALASERVRLQIAFGALGTLAASLSGVLALFVLFDLFFLPIEYRARILVGDSINLGLALATFVAKRKGYIVARRASYAVLFLLLCTATNSMSGMAVTGNRSDIGFLAIEAISGGVLLARRTELLFVLGYLFLGGFFATRGFTPGEAVDCGLVLLASSTLSLTIFQVRVGIAKGITRLLDRLRYARADASRALRAAREEIRHRQEVEADRERYADALLQAKKMEAIGTLAGGIAHDMNNVLMAVQCSAELISASVERDSPIAEDVEIILRAARRGAEFTKNLLGVARKGKLREEDVDLAATTYEIERLLSRMLPKGIVVENDVADELFVRGDPSQLGHLVMNLLINAADAMNGAGPIHVCVVRKSLSSGDRRGLDAGEYVALVVSDRGPGIPAALREHVFEPFFTTKEVGKGTGLGLAMVYAAVKDHRGTIECFDREGGGTTFEVLLPMIENRRVSALPTSRRESGPSKLVLLVDDDPLVRSASSRMLRKLGHSVLTAHDGANAIEVWKANAGEIDLVLLDMSMPVVDGAECFRRLRELSPEIDVIVCSGYAKDRATEGLLHEGARGFLLKPYSQRDLERSVGQVLGPSL